MDIGTISKARLLITTAVSIMSISLLSLSGAQASECYHHYNDEAWHGRGLAIVFCLNSGGYDYPGYGDSLPMESCELWYHEGEKIMDLYTNPMGTDHDRQIMTDHNTLGTTFLGHSVDFVCVGENGKTYTFVIPDAGYWTPAPEDYVCPGPGYLGPDSVCKDDHNPILTVNKSGQGMGSITGTPNSDVIKTDAIDCDSSCTSDNASYHFYSKKQVTLTATPDTGYVFTGWSGGNCSGTGTCTLTMDKDITVTAMFSKVTLVPQNSLLLDGTK